MSIASRLLAIYERLYGHFGPQHWWPADSAFEVMVGAILTQNTNWQNVNKAIERLRNAGLLDFEGLTWLPEKELAELIRASGYYNIKARRLKNLLAMLGEHYDGRLEKLFEEDTDTARRRLLSVQGIGEETADSILLYAGNHPVFVVDAYTHRIFSRHSLVPEECDYRTLQELFTDNLPPEVELFNEYHALLVVTAKHFCRKTKPLCEHCPLCGM